MRDELLWCTYDQYVGAWYSTHRVFLCFVMAYRYCTTIMMPEVYIMKGIYRIQCNLLQYGNILWETLIHWKSVQHIIITFQGSSFINIIRAYDVDITLVLNLLQWCKKTIINSWCMQSGMPADPYSNLIMIMNLFNN